MADALQKNTTQRDNAKVWNWTNTESEFVVNS